MKLSYISIANYRSITDAYKIDLSNLTVLLGKNNEGKTNIIKAINLGMDILRNMELYHRRRFISKQLYDWHEDFPISLQLSKKLKNKQTTIRMDFTMNEAETNSFHSLVNSNINGQLSIYVKINEDNSLSVTIPKRGKNAKAISSKILSISKFICQKFDVQYIPAVRSESDAYNAISDLVDAELSSIEDQTYKDSIEYIEKMQKERLDLLASKVKKPLETFLPQIKSISLYMADRYRRSSFLTRKSVNIEIDDGVLTSLSNKGDGVKSLATIAMLSQVSTNKDRLVIVDEPENHLHPEAIRYIDSVLCDLAKQNQVLISTHSPIFVNRNSITSNIIVETGKAQKADRIDTIRSTLGVICSDNLMYSDYVVVVEGPTDRNLLNKLFLEDEQLCNCVTNKTITIRSIGGTNNLKSEVYALQRYCCNYIILLDFDNAGKTAANDIKQALSVPDEKIRYFMKNRNGECELEDLYKPEIYKEYLMEQGLDISNVKFRNQSTKWSNRLANISADVGVDFSKEMEDKFKEEIANLIDTPIKNYISESGYSLLTSITDKIKHDLEIMSIL
jgi:predicted ATP-dependent endonuclease of OLD family